ncbi:hypothetical protein ABZ912_05155 [Nonomuraea angiospora]|uniref:hypothetical protein n=1 Tax=Nonomuraea angiospora TaxID=46172 RepID=UPI00340F3F60
MRIHVLRLPLVEMGGIHEEPFALIVDQFQPGVTSEETAARERTVTMFAEQAGARALWVTEQTVEIVEQPVPAVLDTVADVDDLLEF